MRRWLPVLLLAAACSSGPEPEDFDAGTCRDAAPDVLAVGEALDDLGDGPRVDREVRDALRDAQDRLAAVAEGAEPALKQPLDDLVVAIGAVRIRADGNTYEEQLGDRAQAAYDAVLGACGAD